jgi:16S rRNA (guanine966-N2)-methyltransferase
VTRIIAGSAGGRRLRTPAGDRTRPTSDRVREALFSAVESALGSLEGLAFLDLYAGSGAVGLEAASRGAHPVTLVEQDRRTAGLIGDNAHAVGLPAEVVCAAVGRHLAGPPSSAYDVVFLDPPYGLSSADVEADLRALAGGWLGARALVVVERPARDRSLQFPDGFATGRVRRYGETTLSYATWVGYGRDHLPAADPEEP